MYTIFKILEILLIVSACHGRVVTAPRQARLSLAEPMPNYYYTNVNGYPGTYSYGYDIVDPATGNTQFRTEERYPNGTVVGSYGHVDARGRPHRYRYIADARGYRVLRNPPNNSYGESVTKLPAVSVTTEPSISWTRPSKKKNKKDSTNNMEMQRKNYYTHRQNGYMTYLF